MTEARIFLSRSEFAERIGVKMDTLARYKLPGTVDAWNAARPGKGGRPPKNTSTK